MRETVSILFGHESTESSIFDEIYLLFSILKYFSNFGSSFNGTPTGLSWSRSKMDGSIPSLSMACFATSNGKPIFNILKYRSYFGSSFKAGRLPVYLFSGGGGGAVSPCSSLEGEESLGDLTWCFCSATESSSLAGSGNAGGALLPKKLESIDLTSAVGTSSGISTF